MKKILSFILSIATAMTLSTSAFAADFEDTKDHANAEAIEVLSSLEIVNGFNETTYAPDALLSRAQLCTMLTRAMYSNDLHYHNVNLFNDVPMTHWARQYIDTAYRYNLMVGFGNGNFGPDETLTYTQTARTILNALGYGTLSWPDGVNLIALELGLYEGIAVSAYETGCTRAHAAQMIYNAFDLELVKDYAGIPMRTDKTFLADKLGYTETTVFEDGHEYVAYKNAEDKIYRTDIVLTTEVQIYSDRTGAYFRFEDNARSEKFAIDYDVIEFYVNDTLTTIGMKTHFKDSDIAYGIFDNDKKLVGIKVVNTGDCYVPATGYGADTIPADIREEVEEDRDYNFETSTITYFNESGKYEISNSIICGFVTKVSRTSIYVDFELQNIPKHTDYEVGQYLVLYFDVNGILADVRVIDEPFFYNFKDMTYHTWECEFYADRANDKNWAIGIEAAADKYTGDDEWVEFDCCEECHTEEWGDDSIAVIHIADNQTCYVVKDGDYYHSKKCEEYTTYKAEMMKTTLGKAKDSGYEPCVKCAGHFE